MLVPLARLARLESAPRRSTLVAFGLLGTLVALAALPAKAADTLPVAGLDARAAAGVTPADTDVEGTVRASLRLRTSAGVFDHQALRSATPDGEATDALLRDANRGSVFLGATLGQRLELSLGLHGTYEHVRAGSRDALFQQAAWRQNVKQSGFSGASLLVKMQVLEADGFQLALAPFLESGAGEQATFSLTRSVNPKAGFMALASYGATGVGAVTLNAGGRYREPEAIGGVVLRNEIFYKAHVRADLSREVALFVTGEGRRLMVAKGDERDDANKLQYRAQEAGEAGGGLALTLGETEVTAFGSARMRGTNGFGYGARSYGLSLATTVGNYRGERPRHSAAADVERKEAARAEAEARARKPLVGPPAPAPEKDEYPEMIGDAIDPLEALGSDAVATDDFKDVERILKENEAAAQTESEDEKLTRELREIREAELKAEAERQRVEAEEREERRANAVKQAAKEDKLMREWMDEAKREADGLDGIEREEIDWRGLED